MATDTSKLAPRIIINEHDLEMGGGIGQTRKPPITLIFGFAPVGKQLEMVVCNSRTDIYNEFGQPSTAAEKYFIDSGLRLVDQGATALMTRLPYDNVQSHMVKYIDFKLEDPISMYDISTVPRESIMREKDDYAVTILKEMHNIDNSMNQLQRITPIQDASGTHIGIMSNEDLVEMELDPEANVPEGTFRIVDIRGEQYSLGAGNQEYLGIFPIFVTAPMALYFQGRIENSESLDEAFGMLDVRNGIEMSTTWWKHANPLTDEVKLKQAQIVASITQKLNFNFNENKNHLTTTFQDKVVSLFPSIHLIDIGKLQKEYLNQVGLFVCRLVWDADMQRTEIEILERFVGKLGRAKGSLDRVVNANSKYIRMYKNFKVPVETDFYVMNDQNIMSLGMEANECGKYINYKTSIMDPVKFMLENVYNDVDSLQLDVILDAGLSSIAFASYVDKTSDGESFKQNDQVKTTINWTSREYDMERQMQDYADVWTSVTKMFGEFIKNVRGDCVYIADGPRIANLERNYPIRNYTDLDNATMLRKFLPKFNGYYNCYVAKYWNWVYMEDMQWQNTGIWVPGSVVMGSQLALNDRIAHLWYAPAGLQRGIIQDAYDVSVRTKQYNNENDLMYQYHWNYFSILQNEGVVVEGQKTTQARHTSLDRLNVRRLVCWIKQQVRIIANRYKYEPHVGNVKEQFSRDVSNLLDGIQRGQGISEYVVICDSSNNNIRTLDDHELFMKIGIKPIKAIEYIVIDLTVGNGAVAMDDNMMSLR